MPEADGGDVATAIREHPATTGIPIIFVSAMVSRKESGTGLYQSGGEHFLAKPVSRETLTRSIQQILASGSRSKSPDSPQTENP
jgi:CheY-like chemotaxis protein